MDAEHSTAEKEKAYQAAYREKNQERIAAYLENNKERIAARAADYYKKNRAHILAQKIEYARKNKKRIAARNIKAHQILLNRFYDRYGLKKEGHEHGVCTCCKDRDLVLFGTLSHIDGSGNHHRKLTNRNTGKMLKEAIAVYDQTRFAAECFCCNMGVERNDRDTVRAYFDKEAKEDASE